MVEISFIVPVYNTPVHMLKACVESILDIKPLKYEIILVDDGSTPELSSAYDAYVKSLKCPHIQCVHQVNRGVSAARNTGISLASGQYIMFVDSDDTIYASALQGSYDADIVLFDYAVKKRHRSIRVVQPVKEGDATQLRENYVWAVLSRRIGACRYLYKRRFLQEKDIHFEEGCVQGEDAAFNFSCMMNEPVLQYVHSPLYCYHYSPKTTLGRWEKYPDQMIDNIAERYACNMKHLASFFPESDGWRWDYMRCARIRELFFQGVDLCSVNCATPEKKRKIEEMMKCIALPEDAKRGVKRQYYWIVNGAWALLWVLAKVRMLFIKMAYR